MQRNNPFFGPIAATDIAMEIHAVPDSPGVYLWRRVLSIEDNAYIDPSVFMSWITTAISRQYFGSVDMVVKTSTTRSAVTIRDNFVRVNRLEIGGAELKPSHCETLKAISENAQARRLVIDLLAQAAALFGPVIYVGQAKSLRERVAEHLSGRTALLKRLQDNDMSATDIALHYLILPDSDDKERCAVEACITNLSVSPLVMREG